MQRLRLLLASALLFFCLTVGGGGANSPRAAMFVQLAALPLLLYELAQPIGRPRSALHATSLGLLLLAVLLPILQLIPLPPAIWTALPGRALLSETYEVTGSALPWRPWTVDAEATRRAALHLIPGAALFLSASRLDEEGRVWLVRLIVATGILGLLVGAFQLTSTTESAVRFYASSPQQIAVGFFANRNHQADFMLTCLAPAAALVALASSRRGLLYWAPLAAIPIFIIGVIAANSRMCLLLLPPTLVAIFFILPGMSRDRHRAPLTGAGMWITLSIVAALLLASGFILPRLLDRFQTFHDLRFDFWEDTIWAIGEYFPAGSGVGAFDIVFRSAERLEMLFERYVNHAHNDYLEIALEAGLPGVAGLVAFFAWLAAVAVGLWKDGRQVSDYPLRAAALVAIGVIALHSTVDYPLRTEALLGLFAVMTAFLAAPAGRVRRRVARDRAGADGLAPSAA